MRNTCAVIQPRPPHRRGTSVQERNNAAVDKMDCKHMHLTMQGGGRQGRRASALLVGLRGLGRVFHARGLRHGALSPVRPPLWWGLWGSAAKGGLRSCGPAGPKSEVGGRSELRPETGAHGSEFGEAWCLRPGFWRGRFVRAPSGSGRILTSTPSPRKSESVAPMCAKL